MGTLPEVSSSACRWPGSAGLPAGLLFHCQACARGQCLNPLLLRFFFNLLQYYFCFVFWFFGHEALWDLSPPTRDPTCTPVLEDEVLTIGPLGSPEPSFLHLLEFPFTFHFHASEKEMATHSSVLAWRIPGTGEPGGLPSLGSHRFGHD